MVFHKRLTKHVWLICRTLNVWWIPLFDNESWVWDIQLKKHWLLVRYAMVLEELSNGAAARVIEKHWCGVEWHEVNKQHKTGIDWQASLTLAKLAGTLVYKHFTIHGRSQGHIFTEVTMLNTSPELGMLLIMCWFPSRPRCACGQAIELVLQG